MLINMVGISMDHLTSCARHSHSQWEIVVCLQGKAILHVGEMDIAFEPGVIVCQPPNVPHSLTEAENYRDMHIRIDNFVSPCPEEVPVFQDDEGRRFTSLVQMMYESFFRRESNSDKIISALWEVMYQLLTGWSNSHTGNSAVSALVHTMVLNISNTGFDLAEHIRKNAYSSDHFRRCFKKEMGLTPTAYMIKLRLDHARHILDLPEQGGFTVKQIAYQSGFSDPYYFSNTFKKHMGCSPTEYIRRK